MKLLHLESLWQRASCYASNIMTINAWCKRYKMKTLMTVIPDDFDSLTRTLKTISEDADAIITSGGAWTGDRDLVVQVLEGLGWQQFFHRIRIGPGKAVEFGMLDGKPVFVLPGGPSSNLMGFLQIALPGCLLSLGIQILLSPGSIPSLLLI